MIQRHTHDRPTPLRVSDEMHTTQFEGLDQVIEMIGAALVVGLVVFLGARIIRITVTQIVVSDDL